MSNYCDDCVYWAKLHEPYRYCSYLLRTDKKRPCPPGEGCTVKVSRKVNRRKKKVASNEAN